MDKLDQEDVQSIVALIWNMIEIRIGQKLDSLEYDVIWNNISDAIDNPLISTGEWRSHN